MKNRRWRPLATLLTGVLAVGLSAGTGCKKEERRPSAEASWAESGKVANAAEATKPYVTTSDVNIRTGPGTQYSVITTIKKGTKINVAGREGEWLRVISKRGNPPGYVLDRFARPLEGQKDAPASAEVRGVFVTTEEVNVRTGPGAHHEIIATIPKDTKVHVVAAEGEWLRIESKHGKPPGYIPARYARRP